MASVESGAPTFAPGRRGPLFRWSCRLRLAIGAVCGDLQAGRSRRRDLIGRSLPACLVWLRRRSLSRFVRSCAFFGWLTCLEESCAAKRRFQLGVDDHADLTNPLATHSELDSDCREGPVFVVLEYVFVEHDLLASGETATDALDCGSNSRAHAEIVELNVHGLRAVRQHVAEFPGIVVAGRVVERQNRLAEDPAKRLDRRHLHRVFFGHHLHRALARFAMVAEGSHLFGQPDSIGVRSLQFLVGGDRAADALVDPRDRIGGECAPLRVELADRVEETKHPFRDEVFDVNEMGSPSPMVRALMDEPHVARDHEIARTEVAGLGAAGQGRLLFVRPLLEFGHRGTCSGARARGFRRELLPLHRRSQRVRGHRPLARARDLGARVPPWPAVLRLLGEPRAFLGPAHALPRRARMAAPRAPGTPPDALRAHRRVGGERERRAAPLPAPSAQPIRIKFELRPKQELVGDGS